MSESGLCVFVSQAASRDGDRCVGKRGVSPVRRAGAVHASCQSNHPAAAAGSAPQRQRHAAEHGDLHLRAARRTSHRHCTKPARLILTFYSISLISGLVMCKRVQHYLKKTTTTEN